MLQYFIGQLLTHHMKHFFVCFSFQTLLPTSTDYFIISPIVPNGQRKGGFVFGFFCSIQKEGRSLVNMVLPFVGEEGAFIVTTLILVPTHLLA